MAHFVKAGAGNYNGSTGWYTSANQQLLNGTTYSLVGGPTQNAGMTWASSHTSKGVILYLMTNIGLSPNDIDQSVKVDLYSNGVQVATVTLTTAQIVAGGNAQALWSNNGRNYGIYTVCVVWPTPPSVTSGQAFYYKLTQTGGTKGGWYTYIDSINGPWFVEFTTTTTGLSQTAADYNWITYDTTVSASTTFTTKTMLCSGATLTFAE